MIHPNVIAELLHYSSGARRKRRWQPEGRRMSPGAVRYWMLVSI